ncbi:hypothetical protein LIER_05245 [Lithospermum erythrorhizon]|uniref:Reverse transcriptase domain-containing protein n=1 Tax=Lithospermum erythrorhizon TaxID=34254 RepID=A0AAV3P158_LITER
MKFPTPGGIGEICGVQKKARICYRTSVPPLGKSKSERRKKRSRENHMEVNVIRNEEEEDNSPKEKDSGKKGEPHEEIKEISFERGNVNRTFQIGTKLGKEHRRNLIALIREYKDVFEDIPGIDPNIAVHRLYADPTFQPIKQKKGLFNDEKNKAIRKECGHEVFDFMDASRGYHQIKILPDDAEKTAFISGYDLYCWKVMSFGLKNASTTYQRMVNFIFASQIGRNMKIYVDDILVKSIPRRIICRIFGKLLTG